MKKIIILIILTIITFSGCHDFTNQFDPFCNVTAFYPLEGDGENRAGIFNNSIMNNVEFIEGHFGDEESACELNGYSSYINCGLVGGLSDIINNQSSFSISLWFYRVDRNEEAGNNMLGKYNDASNYGYWVDLNNNCPRFEVDQDGMSADLVVQSTTTYADYEWHNLVIAGRELYDDAGEHLSSEIRMFIDGVLIGTDSGEYPLKVPTLSPLVIGGIKLVAGSSDGESEFNVDNIKIFSNYLGSVEAQALFNETEDEYRESLTTEEG